MAQEGQTSAITPDFIIAAFAAASSNTRNFAVDFVEYVGLNSFDENLTDRRPFFDVNIVRAGSRISVDSRLWNESDNTWGHTILKYDGRFQKVHFPGAGTGIIRGVPPTDDDIGLNPIPWQSIIWGRNLADRVSADELAILPELDDVDNKPCYVVIGRDAEFPDILQYKLWLDPDVGFMPRRIDEITAGDPSGPMSRRIFRDYQELEENVWVARRIDTLALDPASGEIRTRNITLVTEFAANQTLSAEIFQIDFPASTYIEDEVMGTTYGTQPGKEDEVVAETLDLAFALDRQLESAASDTGESPLATPADEDSATSSVANKTVLGFVVGGIVFIAIVGGVWAATRKNRH